MTKAVKNLAIIFEAVAENHRLNGGQALYGNQPMLKSDSSGRSYISGQMSRRALKCSMDNLKDASDYINRYFSEPESEEGDDILNDKRKDLFGFMDPNGKKRNSPLNTTITVARDKSIKFTDFVVQYKKDKDNAIVNMETSQKDILDFNFTLDIKRVGKAESLEYIDKEEKILVKKLTNVVDEDERRYWISNLLEASQYLSNFANQARNTTDLSPKKVLIIFDHVANDNKYLNFFKKSKEEQDTLIKILDKRKIEYYIGEDLGSVDAAYEQAIEGIRSGRIELA